MISIENFENNILNKYLARIVSKSRNKRKYIIDDFEIIQNLLNSEEKKKCKFIEQQLFQTIGYIPQDEYTNVGKTVEIVVHLYKGVWLKRFEISPICDLLFEQLIVMIGYDDSDKEKHTSKYKRYLAAQKYLNCQEKNL